MDTTRLSEVITGCGRKLTTCSRMSTLVRTASMNGISRFSPGVSVRWYLPSRSTTSIRCCGTTRTDRTNVTTTKRANTAANVMRKTSSTSIPPHQGGSALDLNDPDPFSDRIGLAHVVRPGEPGFTLDLDHSVLGVDGLHHDAGRSLDRLDAHRYAGATQVQVAA